MVATRHRMANVNARLIIAQMSGACMFYKKKENQFFIHTASNWPGAYCSICRVCLLGPDRLSANAVHGIHTGETSPTAGHVYPSS
jgi:hypothetical protein